MELPKRFLEEMRAIPGLDYDAFLRSYDMEGMRGLRINTKKISVAQWQRISPFSLNAVPWIANGYFYTNEETPSKDVYYYAGLYYIQEPSAMTPANRLPIAPDDRVLDLCAAPGGKATELGAKLAGSGLLVANDVSASRAGALLRNLERAGIDNCVVTAEAPQKLAAAFPAYFDKILVDAPCSGEGMFRREPSMLEGWLEKDSSFYAPLQREILSCAVRMLKPGGLLMYSTCTFSPQENEENVRYLMDECGMSPEQITPYEGFSEGFIPDCVRIWPHLMRGEGHFLALLRKPDDGKMNTADVTAQNDAATDLCRTNDGKMNTADVTAQNDAAADYPKLLQQSDFPEFMMRCSYPVDADRIFLHRDGVYLLPVGFSNPAGIRILSSGLKLGTLKNRRFSPGQAFAAALRKEQFADTVDFVREDVRVRKYLKGETIGLDAPAKGWQLVCVDGFPLGWGKASQTTLKNKYDAGWRIQ